MILGNVVFKDDGVEQSLLVIRLKPKHYKAYRSFGMRHLAIQGIKNYARFSTQ